MPAIVLSDAASPFLIRRITLDGSSVVLEAEGSAATGACPSCGCSSGSVHDRYTRKPVDLPWRGWVVRLVLTARRFRCVGPVTLRLILHQGTSAKLHRPFTAKVHQASSAKVHHGRDA